MFANVCTHDGHQLSWVKELRYLGIFIVSSRNFKRSLDHAKRSFYRAANSIFGKIGRIASEDVLIELHNYNNHLTASFPGQPG